MLEVSLTIGLAREFAFRITTFKPSCGDAFQFWLAVSSLLSRRKSLSFFGVWMVCHFLFLDTFAFFWPANLLDFDVTKGVSLMSSGALSIVCIFGISSSLSRAVANECEHNLKAVWFGQGHLNTICPFPEEKVTLLTTSDSDWISLNKIFKIIYLKL